MSKKKDLFFFILLFFYFLLDKQHIPSGWTVTVEEKNYDATFWNPWPLDQKLVLDMNHRKNVRITLTENTAQVSTPYSFTLTFRAHDG